MMKKFMGLVLLSAVVLHANAEMSFNNKSIDLVTEKQFQDVVALVKAGKAAGLDEKQTFELVAEHIENNVLVGSASLSARAKRIVIVSICAAAVCVLAYIYRKPIYDSIFSDEKEKGAVGGDTGIEEQCGTKEQPGNDIENEKKDKKSQKLITDFFKPKKKSEELNKEVDKKEEQPKEPIKEPIKEMGNGNAEKEKWFYQRWYSYWFSGKKDADEKK